MESLILPQSNSRVQQIPQLQQLYRNSERENSDQHQQEGSDSENNSDTENYYYSHFEPQVEETLEDQSRNQKQKKALVASGSQDLALQNLNAQNSFSKCLRPYFLSIAKHTVVDEKHPFVLYAIEIESEFSRLVVLKQFSDFATLQQKLLRYKDKMIELNPPRFGYSVQPEYQTLQKLIPKLPTSLLSYIFNTSLSPSQIQINKQSLGEYSQKLIDLLTRAKFAAAQYLDNQVTDNMDFHEEEELVEAPSQSEKQARPQIIQLHPMISVIPPTPRIQRAATTTSQQTSRNSRPLRTQQTYSNGLSFLDQHFVMANAEWAQVVIDFFQLEKLYKRELEGALKIQSFYKNIKRNKLKKCFLRYIYIARGFSINLMSMPADLITSTFSYLTEVEKFKLGAVCQSLHRTSRVPALWRSLKVFNKLSLSHVKMFDQFVHKCSQLQVVSFKFCPFISTETMLVIAHYANPYFLKELYLDGCDKVSDASLSSLVRGGNTRREFIPDFSDPCNTNANEFNKVFGLLIDGEESRAELAQQVGFGGAHGLQTISLAECKNISDAGMEHIKSLRFLHRIVLLGCYGIKDEGVQQLASNLKYLEDIDISGTQITAASLHHLATHCLNIRFVNISGCKYLNASDEQVLTKNHINVECGDDVFRFYLNPDPVSELPKITQSVLKTRATLSVHKVYRYLIKKLHAEKVIEDISDDQLADSQVEILCSGQVLNPQMQLKVVKEKYWLDHHDQRILELHYRKKETPSKAQTVTLLSSYRGLGLEGIKHLQAGSVYSKSSFVDSRTHLRAQSSNSLLERIEVRENEYLPRKPPLWVPDHMAINCLKCEEEFSFFTRIHHCRNCGKCFCARCANYWVKLEEFGYNKPVRVCRPCFATWKQATQRQQSIARTMTQS